MSREMKNSGVEWIGEIPDDWDLDRIKNILIERKEMNKPVKTDFILSLTNDRGVIPYSEKGDIGNKSKEDLTSYKLAYPGDIVLNSMNAIIGSIGLSKYFGAVSPVYYMLRPRSDTDNVEYFNWLFQTKQFQENLKGYGNGIMELRMRISMGKLNTILIPYPNRYEQIKISHVISEKVEKIDFILEQTKSTIEDYKLLKQSIITEAVTKGLEKNVEMRDSGIEWIGEIPSNWGIVKLKNICYMKSGDNLISDQIEQEGKFPVYGGNGIRGYYNEYNREGESILIGRQGALCGNIQFANDRFWATEHALVTKIKEEYSSSFYFYFLQFMNLNQYSQSAAQPGLSAKVILNLDVCIPPVNIQEAIAEKLHNNLSNIDILIEKKESLIDELQSYKKSVIYEYVTGKKEVK
ncbi:restriction endonuclease subunit S [Proteiniclasticum sp. C24MP]|uniref:restriction endonuclease subunit S n=1 Tax=Proteiniclasticum sp. C24MP TaxID=3374101 RepID=UPI0037542812